MQNIFSTPQFLFTAIMSFGLAIFPVQGITAQKPASFDVLITHGRIVDGSGNPWFRGDVGIVGSKIVAVGHLANAEARTIIDAHDHIVAPGFIEMMGEDSYVLAADSFTAESKLQQGCTTMSAGEGFSAAPMNDFTAKEFLHDHPGAKVTWSTFAEFDSMLTKKGIGINVIHNVGADQVRRYVIGDTDRAPTEAELEQMKALVARAMQDGAYGLSSALIYPPANYASTKELIALAKVAGQYGGIYLSHVRNESNDLLPALDEAIEIGKQAGVPVHIYHLKAAGSDNWQLIEPALEKIQAARNAGLEITADTYPYLYNGFWLSSFLPPDASASGNEVLIRKLADPAERERLKSQMNTRRDYDNWWAHIDKDWNNVLIAKVSQGMDSRYEGQTLHQVAIMRGKDDWTTYFDLVAEGNPFVSPRSMNEDQKRLIYKEPWVSISSDATPANRDKEKHLHPRVYGTFPRIYAKYVREDHVLTLEDAVRKMTSLPADQLGMFDRGRIGPGMAADVVIFDPNTIRDTATFAKPAVIPEGIDDVLVNGILAVDHGKGTGALAGKVLLHNSLHSQK